MVQRLGLAGHKNASYALLAQLGLLVLHFVLESAMLKTNPRYVLRNHLGEQAIRAAQEGNYSEVHALQLLLERPFDEHPGFEAHARFPPDWARHISISCSS